MWLSLHVLGSSDVSTEERHLGLPLHGKSGRRRRLYVLNVWRQRFVEIPIDVRVLMADKPYSVWIVNRQFGPGPWV